MKHRMLLLGLGFWGSRWLKLLLENPRCELCGVAGAPEELERVCFEYRLAKSVTYTDFREAIAQTNADVAVVVLPGRLHFEADQLALKKGMHVITEKPLAMSMDEANRLLEVKAACPPSQKFMASQNYRWRPHNQTIRRAIQAGKLGKLDSILLEFRQQEDLQGYRGGLDYPLLEDMSIHHFDLLRFFTNADCREISACAWRPDWSLYPGQPNTNAVIQMDSGVHVCYNASWAARGRETSWDGNLVLTGEKGCITLDANDMVKFYPHHKVSDVVLDMSEQEGEVLPMHSMEHTEMAYGLHYFLDCVENDVLPETTLEDNVKSYGMVAACLQAVKTGQTVTL